MGETWPTARSHEGRAVLVVWAEGESCVSLPAMLCPKTRPFRIPRLLKSLFRLHFPFWV